MNTYDRDNVGRGRVDGRGRLRGRRRRVGHNDEIVFRTGGGPDQDHATGIVDAARYHRRRRRSTVVRRTLLGKPSRTSVIVEF